MNLYEYKTDKLLGLLRQNSYKKGTFTLASGKTSNFYIDCKKTFLDPVGLIHSAELLAKIVKQKNPEGIAGEGVGGITLATATVTNLAVRSRFYPLIIIRKATKDHGSKNRVEYAPKDLLAGDSIVLIEDVLTTGGSVIRAAEALREEGFICEEVIALVNRSEGADENLKKAGLSATSLYNKSNFVK